MCSEEKQENIQLPWQPHHRDLREVSPVALAFVGDGVYEVLVRQRLVTRTRLAPGRLHGLAVKFVSAAGQSRALEAILPLLTEEEAAVVQRGKNSSKASVAKHATPSSTEPARPLSRCWAGCSCRESRSGFWSCSKWCGKPSHRSFSGIKTESLPHKRKRKAAPLFALWVESCAAFLFCEWMRICCRFVRSADRQTEWENQAGLFAVAAGLFGAGSGLVGSLVAGLGVGLAVLCILGHVPFLLSVGLLLVCAAGCGIMRKGYRWCFL